MKVEHVEAVVTLSHFRLKREPPAQPLKGQVVPAKACDTVSVESAET